MLAPRTLVRSYVNRVLRHVNLQLDTLTREKIEDKRLHLLEENGYFKKPIFLAPRAFESKAFAEILEELRKHESRFDDFEVPSRNDVGYTFNNDFFSSPDAEVLYTVIRKLRPRRVVEIGSGNSTKVIRQAILDGDTNTHLISIDPRPRTEITDFADICHHKPVETLEDKGLFQSLKEGDILFIDSSHEIKTGNDVVFLYLSVIPELSPGVLIHIHDIFLPYEYPREWVIEKRWGWNEQYLVQALLTFNTAFEVLWPGHFLQRTLPGFSQFFSHMSNRPATSLWLEKK